MITKDARQIIKHLRKFMQDRYKDIVMYIIKSDVDTQVDCIQNVKYYLQNVPHFLDIVKWLRTTAEVEQAEAEFDAQVNPKLSVQDYFAQYIDNQITLVAEKIARIHATNVTQPNDIRIKQHNLQKYQKQLDDLQVSKTAISSLRKQLEPEKRGPGRPKKEKAQNQ